MKDDYYLKIEKEIKESYEIINQYKQDFINDYNTFEVNYKLADVIGLYEDIKEKIDFKLKNHTLAISMNINLNKEYDKLMKSLDKQIKPLLMKVMEED